MTTIAALVTAVTVLAALGALLGAAADPPLQTCAADAGGGGAGGGAFRVGFGSCARQDRATPALAAAGLLIGDYPAAPGKRQTQRQMLTRYSYTIERQMLSRYSYTTERQMLSRYSYTT
eukprot:gene2766-7483_t